MYRGRPDGVTHPTRLFEFKSTSMKSLFFADLKNILRKIALGTPFALIGGMRKQRLEPQDISQSFGFGKKDFFR